MGLRIWRIRPLSSLIVEVLKKNGRMTDDKLLDYVRAFYPDVSMAELSRALMTLEMNGFVYVASYMRGRKIVELRWDRLGREP